MEQAEIDVTLSRIKVIPPHLVIWFDEPRIAPFTDEEKEMERRHIEANEAYMKALDEIYGEGVEVGQYLGVQWVYPKWFSEKYRMALAVSWSDFRRWTNHLIAEAYAMHKSAEKDKKDAETKTP